MRWRDCAARLIGFVFQFFHLMPSLTAFENVLVPMETRRRHRRAPTRHALAARSGPGRARASLPVATVGWRAAARGLARALANDPPMILADEPTGNLDCDNGRHVIDLLFDINRRRGTTLVLVTHDRELAARAECRSCCATAASSSASPRGGPGGHRRGLTERFILRMVARETACRLEAGSCSSSSASPSASARSPRCARSSRTCAGRWSREARTLIAADVVVSTNRAWPPDVARASTRDPARRRAHSGTEIIETATMVRPADPGSAVARMVELQAVEPGYPALRHAGAARGRAYTHDLLRNRGALVGRNCWPSSGIAVGDGSIGTEPFTIRGVIASEPGRRLACSASARGFSSTRTTRGTGLLPFGSRARHVTAEAGEARIEPLVRACASGSRHFVNGAVVSVDRGRDRGGLDDAENYLSLVGLVIVVLGGIGVWSVTRVFVAAEDPHDRRSEVPRRATPPDSRHLRSSRCAVLGQLGSLLWRRARRGIALRSCPPPLDLVLGAVGCTPHPVGDSPRLSVIGLLVSLFFSLVPLLEVRRIRPSLPVAGRVGPARPRRRLRGRWAATAVDEVAGRDGVACWPSSPAWQAASPHGGLHGLRWASRRDAVFPTRGARGGGPSGRSSAT